jgi:hypothetical protein
MIELNERTQMDFLNRKWVKKLSNAGMDMSNAKYIIAKDKLSMYDDEPDLTDYVWYKDSTAEVYDACPTLSISELYNECELYRSKEDLYEDLKCEDWDRPLIIALAEELIKYLKED